MLKSRTFGWIQNPGKFENLKKTVQIFDKDSKHYHLLASDSIYLIEDEDVRSRLIEKLNRDELTFTYLDLVGTGTSKRSEAKADALIQVSILPQTHKTTGKRYIDNWSADGFLRWAVSLGFVDYHRESDTFSITDSGLTYSKTEHESEEEKDILIDRILSYPPATRVLQLINEADGKIISKFEIGSKLGFNGEPGFTSYDEDLIFEYLSTLPKSKKKDVRADVEGTADKYARMIAGWLQKLGFVKQARKTKVIDGIEEYISHAYQITVPGKQMYNRTIGKSSHARKEKLVMWEMLATTVNSRDYHRTRRAYILKQIEKTKSMKVLLDQLRLLGFDDDEVIIRNDLSGLKQIGINIELSGNKVELKDTLNNFKIPDLNITEQIRDKALEKKKAEFLKKLSLPASYIELLEIAFDPQQNRTFEIKTAEIFKEMYGLSAKHLGGSRKPDGVAYHKEKYGIIIDTKAYSKGYNLPVQQADEMIRYVMENKKRNTELNPNEWWNEFPKEIPENKHYFLWISGKFIGQFQNNLEYTANRTGQSGAVIDVEQLLIGADLVKKGQLTLEDLPNYFNNKSIVFES